MSHRTLTSAEISLIQRILDSASHLLPSDWHQDVLVRPLNDGGMGSLRFVKPDDRKFGRMLGEHLFKDKDGIDVIATIYLDQEGDLFELEIWKTDFSPVKQLPETNIHPKRC